MSFKNLFQLAFISSIAMTLSCSGSSSDPSPVPELSFVSSEYVLEELVIGNVALPRHTIRLTFAYQDGDEDLGILSEDLVNGLGDDRFIKDSNGDFILIGSQAGLPEFSCEDYEIIRIDENQNIIPGDTVLIDRNLIVGNATFKFLYEDQNGEFVPFDQRDFFEGIGCNPNFDRYITDVNETVPVGAPYSIQRDGSKRGMITFDHIDFAFDHWLDIADFKVEITMYDRAGNQSNTIITDVISK